MTTALTVTNYPEQILKNSFKASTTPISRKQRKLDNFLSNYNIVSARPHNLIGIKESATSIERPHLLLKKEVRIDLDSISDLITTANGLFKHSEPLTGEYMDMLEMTFQKSLSKTPFSI